MYILPPIARNWGIGTWRCMDGSLVDQINFEQWRLKLKACVILVGIWPWLILEGKRIVGWGTFFTWAPSLGWTADCHDCYEWACVQKASNGKTYPPIIIWPIDPGTYLSHHAWPWVSHSSLVGWNASRCLSSDTGHLVRTTKPCGIFKKVYMVSLHVKSSKGIWNWWAPIMHDIYW